MKNKTTTYKWTYLPFVFSSVALIATQATAGPTSSQRYEDAKQVDSINHEYVGGDHNIGFGVDDEGNFDVELNGAFSKSENHRTGGGLWAGYDVDNKEVTGRGGQINHAWVSRDSSGNATHVNKAFAAYDRNAAGHDRATVGFGQENESLFWDGRVSKGLSDGLNKRDQNGTTVTDRAYDWGVGAQVGTHLVGANARIRAGIDHEWSDKVGSKEDDAHNTTLSAGIEKFFEGTGHSLSLDVAGSKKSGGFGDNSDADYNGRLGYKYDFGGASIYQPDRRYRRVRVEVPGKAIPPRYEQQQQYKRVPTYSTVPVYGNKVVRTPTKQLVKSTMELEGQTFFKLNSAKLIPSAQTRLMQIAEQIRKTGYQGSIRITGNTCGLGNARYDQILSERRAKEVRNFLIENGFNPNHLIARGLGKDHPKFPRTPDQDFKNRRVDIEYVTQQQIEKTGYKTENRRVQTGTRQVATGFKNVPAGMKNVMVSSGKPGAPRVVWKTEAIASTPAWIGRALNNTIQHNTSINTFTTTFGNEKPDTEKAPEAQNDTAETTEGTAVTLPVLNNDTSNSGSNQLTISSVGTPSNGVAKIVDGKIVYTPNPGFTGTDSFTYTIKDSNGKIATATATVTVKSSDAPKAENDTATTTEGTKVTLPVLNNDTSNSGSNQLTITSVGTPSNGTVEIIDGKIVYTPNAGFTGTDTFPYTVTDSNGKTAIANATVTVVAADAPKANDDTATTEAGVEVTLPVLGNDETSSGSGRLTITSVGSPLNGTANIVDGQIVYKPNAGFSGTDTFTYTITDSNGKTATATATVTVKPGNGTDPEVKDDTAETKPGVSVTLPVLANDSSNSGSNQLTITSVGDPLNGTTKIVDGQVVYTPNVGFVGTDTFTYTVTDSNGKTATATATVTVKADDAPDVKDDTAETEFGKAVTLPVLANDSSNSGSNQLTISSVGTPSNGTSKIVDGEIVYTPNAGFSGTDSFTYTVTDSNGKTATATATVTVGDEPVEPPKANDDTAGTVKGKSVTLPVLGNDTTSSGSGKLTVSNVGTPLNGTATIVDGEIVYTPNAGFVGKDVFTYTITDSNGKTDTATATVTVSDEPVKPEANDDTATTGFGKTVTLPVLGNDKSNSGSGQLTISSVGTPSNGTVAIVSGELVYTPKAGFSGTDSFTYTITDSNGKTDTATATVKVDAPEKPNAKDDQAETEFGKAVTLPVLGNDTTNSGSGQLTVSSVGSPLNGTATILDGKIVYTPNAGFSGTDSFTYTVTDSNGKTDTATATVVVGEEPVKPKPEANDDTATTDFGVAVTLAVLGNDKSNSGSGQLTITNAGTPSNGTTSVVGGEIVYTPNAGFSGTDSFTYTVTDSTGKTDTATATVVVGEEPVKPKPEANDDAATTDFGKAVTLAVLGNDKSNSGSGQLTITNAGTPSNGTTSVVGGEIVYTPNAGFSGTDSFTYTVTDSTGKTDTATATVNVGKAPNKAPVANDDSATTACDSITINILGNDTDVDGDALSILSIDAGSLMYGTVMQSGNQITYQPSNGCGKGNVGVDTFSYTITDGNGNTDSANVSVTVQGSGIPTGGYPDANTDDALIKAGETIKLNVLDNDTGNGLRIVAVDNPKNGHATTNGTTVIYTPDPGFTGSEMFYYDIVDANGKSDAAMIIVDVVKGCVSGSKCK